MCTRLIRCLYPGLALLFAFALIGCSGGNSAGGGGGGEEAAPLVAQSFNEGCTLCHGSGNIADVGVVHSLATGTRNGQITAVTVDGSTGRVTVNFRVFDSANPLIPLAGITSNNFRFALAKLVPGTNGDASHWQSYINRVDTKDPGEPGNAPDGTQTTQATTETGNATGTAFTDNGDGTYSFRFSFDIRTRTDPVTLAPILYDNTLTHRVAMQVAGNVENASFDFVPAGGPLPLTRDIALNVSCNECHIQLALHDGGNRISLKYCVTCHNPGSTDANSLNTLDFKVMIHKIHYGEHLPSVQPPPGPGGEYAIWGNNNNKSDFSEVIFPQDVRFPGLPAPTPTGTSETCVKCHRKGDDLNSENYLNVPTKEACGSCHDLTSFTDPPPAGYTLHTGGVQVDNGSCKTCHPATGSTPSPPNGISIEKAHQLREQIAAANFKYNIIRIADQNDVLQVDPGDRVRVTFSVTNPKNANAPYDIRTAPEFTAPGGASRLAILIGWSTTDYTNTGSGSIPAQPISINPLAAGVATANPDGSFTVTSSVAIPANVTGSGVAAVEGHPAVETTPGSGTFDLPVPVKNVFQTFAITGSPANRRSLVDINTKCNACHGNLSLHGNNRTGEIQVCVICHNANATDINRRPAGAPAGTLDNKREQAIDFKYMIHAIHVGETTRSNGELLRPAGMVVYGFTGPTDFGKRVRTPAGRNNLKNCTGCHTGTAFAVPLNANALPTTVNTGSNRASPDDDRNITPTASVCSSCHDFIDAKTHMSEEGGQFDFVAFAPEPPPSGGGGSQAELCGPGPISSQPSGHTDRIDCCSCHSFK